MESSLSEDTANKIARTTLTRCIKNRDIDELTKHLNAIKPDNRSQILLDTGTSGITHLSYAIRHNFPKNIIEKILKIAEEGGVLKQLLEIKNHHGNTALDFAKKYNSSKKIVELLLHKEQESGLLCQFEHDDKGITITNCTGITIGDPVKVINEETNQKQVSNDKKLIQVCSGSTPNPSITVDSSTITISNISDIQIDDKGITISGKKIL